MKKVFETCNVYLIYLVVQEKLSECLIVLDTLHKLVPVERLVPACVYLFEDLIDAMVHIILVVLFVHIEHCEKHVEHFFQLFLVNYAVAVYVVDVKGPIEFVLETSL